MTSHYGSIAFSNGDSYVGWMDVANNPHGYGEFTYNARRDGDALTCKRSKWTSGVWTNGKEIYGRFQKNTVLDHNVVSTTNDIYERNNSNTITVTHNRVTIMFLKDGSMIQHEKIYTIGSYSYCVDLGNVREKTSSYTVDDNSDKHSIRNSNNEQKRTIFNDGSSVTFKGRKTYCYRLDGTVEKH